MRPLPLRLGTLARCARLERHGFAPPAVVHQEGGGGIARALDLDAARLVPEFDGEFDRALGLGGVGCEVQFNFPQRAAIRGAGCNADRTGLSCNAQCRHLDAAAIEARRCECCGKSRGFGNDGLHGDGTIRKTRQAVGEFHGLAVIDAIAEPDDAECGRTRKTLLQRVKQSGAIRIKRAGCQGSGFRLRSGCIGRFE